MAETVDARGAVRAMLDLAGVKPTESDLARLDRLFPGWPASTRMPALVTEPALVQPVVEWPHDA